MGVFLYSNWTVIFPFEVSISAKMPSFGFDFIIFGEEAVFLVTVFVIVLTLVEAFFVVATFFVCAFNPIEILTF